jgi:hypothetical protein
MWYWFLAGKNIATVNDLSSPDKPSSDNPYSSVKNADEIKDEYLRFLRDKYRSYLDFTEFRKYKGSIYDGPNLLLDFFYDFPCDEDPATAKTLIKIFLAESLYGSEMSIRPIIDLSDYKSVEFVQRLGYLVTDNEFESSLEKIDSSSQYRLLHVIKQWALTIRSSILNALPDIPCSDPVSDLDKGKKLHSEEIEKVYESISAKPDVGDYISAIVAIDSASYAERNERRKSNTVNESNELSKASEATNESLKDSEAITGANEFNEATQSLPDRRSEDDRYFGIVKECRASLIIALETTILDCCKKMRALELSQYKEFSSVFFKKVDEDLSEVSGTVENTSEDFLQRLAQFKSDVEQFSSYLESEKLLEELDEEISLYDISAFSMAYGNLEDVD